MLHQAWRPRASASSVWTKMHLLSSCHAVTRLCAGNVPFKYRGLKMQHLDVWCFALFAARMDMCFHCLPKFLDNHCSTFLEADTRTRAPPRSAAVVGT